VGRGDSDADLNSDLAMLARAYRASDVDHLAAAAFDDPKANVTGYYSSVEDYYTGTESQLSGVHCPDGAVHFGLDWDGKFSWEGFYEQARMVEAILARNAARNVLEIGSGKGFNSVYLAQRNPRISFTGVDLTPLHVRIATERGRDLPNLRFFEGDFHTLTRYANDSVDVAFDVEAGCHADTPDKVRILMAELFRVLRPGGHFVAFDYCRADNFDDLDRKARLAVQLIERAWVIDRFPRESDWNAAGHLAGFRLTERRDLRTAATPSALRLHRQARMFYLLMATPARPVLARLVRRSTHNAVSALMLPYAFGHRALEYRMAILQKPV
jgi:SAM-dependent methyltransferase